MALFAGDVFVVVAPIENIEKETYYLMLCTKRKMNLLEDYDDNGFIYERWSIILKGYFFQETHQTKSYVHLQEYQSNIINFQNSHLVCAAHIMLIEVQSKKKLKVKKWKMTKVNHEKIIEDDIPLQCL